MIDYSGTVSSNGKQTSDAGGNQVIYFYDPYNGITKLQAKYLLFESFANEIYIKLNGEMTQHQVDANSMITFDSMNIDHFTIITPNVQYRFTAFV